MTPPAASWHVDAALLERYAGRTLDHVRAASVEAHLLGCGSCRSDVVGCVAPERLASVWDHVVDTIDAPGVSLLEGFLRRCGLGPADARLAATTPALRLAWLVALLAVLAFCLLAAQANAVGPSLFLGLAPALPVIGVGLAFNPFVDHTYEQTLATPYSATRLLFLRSAVVLVVTSVPVAIAGLILPGSSGVLWLLPAAALVSASLALSAWLSAATAGAVVAGVWMVGVFVYWRSQATVVPLFDPVGQIVALAVLALAGVLITRFVRQHAYDFRRIP